MALPNVFEQKTIDQIFVRLEKLTPETQAVWGKMNAAQMLAHVNVAYDLSYDRVKSNANFLMKFIVKTFIKEMVVNEKPYKKSGPTSPVFVIKDGKDFEKEKQKLIQDLKLTVEKGAAFFEGKENQSFGKMTSNEWNNMFYKHLDHHFNQFGI